jgi:hypothetical protein
MTNTKQAEIDQAEDGHEVGTNYDAEGEVACVAPSPGYRLSSAEDEEAQKKQNRAYEGALGGALEQKHGRFACLVVRRPA